ncbi:MAG: TolC family protein [bacterium]
MNNLIVKFDRYFLMYLFTFSLFGFSISAQAETVKLTPEQAVDLALKNNKILESGRWTLKLKEATCKGAITGFLPKLAGSASYRRTSGVPGFEFGGDMTSMDFTSLGLQLSDLADTNVQKTLKILNGVFSGMSTGLEMGSRDNYSIGFQITQPIFTGFKIINSFRMAGEAFEMQKMELEKSKQLTAFGALSMYWMAFTLKKSIKVTKDAEAQLARLKQDQEKLFEQNMLAKHDLFQIRASHAKAKVSVLQVTRQYNNLKRQFIDFINLEHDTEVEFITDTENEIHAELQNLDDYIKWVKNNRPDLKQNNNTRNILRLSEKLGKSGYFPTIVAVGGYNYAKPNQQVSFENEWAGSWSIMAMVNWNLFDWGEAYRKGKEAEFQRKAGESGLESSDRNIFTQANNAWESVNESREEYDAAKEAETASELSYKAVNLKHEHGMATTFELLSSHTSLTSAKLTTLQAIVKLKLAIENMKIGGLGTGFGSNRAGAP